MKRSTKPTVQDFEKGLVVLRTPRGGRSWMCRVGIHWKGGGDSWSLMAKGDCKKRCLRKDCPGPRRVRVIEED